MNNISEESITQPGEECYIRNMLDRIGDKWSMLILATLGAGPIRFTALKKTIGDISQRMLAQTLRSLESDGYVSRKVYPTVPPAVEYQLTPFGELLLEKMTPLFQWADAHHAQVKQNRRHYLERTQQMETVA